jgi:transposase
MRDTEFYRQILGLENPWGVEKVELSIKEGKVDIFVCHAEGLKWACPECGRELGCYDHAEERVWRHLDTCQFMTLLHARIPRVKCPEHGVKQVKVPWSSERSRFTLLMERFVVDVLMETATVEGAARLLKMSWDEVWGIMERAVERGLARKEGKEIPFIGVDEKAFKKGHSYMTVVCDLIEGTVEYVKEGREAASLEEYYSSLSEEQIERIVGVAMDMWPAYIKATEECVPEGSGKIVFDRFHVMSHMEKAVDQVRKRENKELMSQGIEDLKGTKYLWLYNEKNLPEKYQPTLARLKNMNLKVGRAWAIKETLRDLWRYKSVAWARRHFKKWYQWASHSRLKPVVKAARTIKNHIEQILTYCKTPITNACAEGLNGKITAIKRRACGYRNPGNFKTAIYFFCGGLNLYPC